MSGSAATSDLVKLALAVLQTGAARNAQQSLKSPRARRAAANGRRSLRHRRAWLRFGRALDLRRAHSRRRGRVAGGRRRFRRDCACRARLGVARRKNAPAIARPRLRQGTHRSPRRRTCSSSIRVWRCSPPCSPECLSAASVRRRRGKRRLPGLSPRRHMSRFRRSPSRSTIRYLPFMRVCASLHAQGKLRSSDDAEAPRPPAL